jgi:hypothetical protein
VLTTWRHAPGHDVSRRGTSCVRTGLLPVIPGSQHRAHPLPGLGLDYSPPSRREHPILPPIFSELRCVRTPLLSSSLSARRRKKEVPLREERYRWPPATLALCLALVRRSRREVRCSHQKAVNVVSAEEGRRFSGAPSLFTEQLRAAGKFSISRSLWSGS